MDRTNKSAPRALGIEKRRGAKWKLPVSALLLACSVIAVLIRPGQMRLDQIDASGPLATIELLEQELPAVDLGAVVACVGIAAIQWYHARLLRRRTIDLPALVVSLTLSCFCIVGSSISCFGDLSFIIGRKAQIPISACVLMGTWNLLYLSLSILFEHIDYMTGANYSRLHGDHMSCQGIETGHNKSSMLVYRAWFFIMIMWSLQCLCFFPGSVPHDARYQLNQFYGLTPLNLHHPPAHTFVIGVLQTLGAYMFGAKNGVLLVSLIQITCGSLVFAHVCCYVQNHLGKAPGCLAVLYYAIYPAWFAYAQSNDKTFIYCLLFTALSLSLAKLFIDNDSSYRNCLAIAVLSVLCCAFRNEAKYVVIPSLFIYICFFRRFRKELICIAVAVLVISSSYQFFLTKGLSLKASNPVEAYSIPIQQIARVVKNHGSELQDGDIAAIDAVIQYDGIDTRYNPYVSDYVKNHYRNFSDDDMDAFWRVWVKLGIEFPGDYLDASLNQMLGCYYPFWHYKVTGAYQFYNKEALGDSDADVVYSEYIESFRYGRLLVIGYVDLWERIPVLSMLVTPAGFVWLLIVLVGAMVHNGRIKESVFLTAPFLCVLACVLSPASGLLRYILPVAGAVPIYLVLVLNRDERLSLLAAVGD